MRVKVLVKLGSRVRFRHTSICFPIYQVVHRKLHRVEGLEVRHRVWQGNLHAWFGIVSLSPQAHSSRTGAEWVCIYYFLFSFTLASVFLSTKWSMESITGLRELRGAPPGLAGQPPCHVWHCLSHQLRLQAPLSKTGAAQHACHAMSVIVSLTSSASRPNSVGQGQSGCVSVFRRSTNGFLMFLIVSCGLVLILGVCFGFVFFLCVFVL